MTGSNVKMLRVVGDGPEWAPGNVDALAFMLQMSRQSGEDLWLTALREALDGEFSYGLTLRALAAAGAGKGPCALFSIRAAYLMRMTTYPLPPYLGDLEAAEEAVGIREALVKKDLRGMDFSGVQIGWNREDRRRYWWEPTDLSGWDLRDTNFGGAALMRTKFVGADLRGANLKDAQFGEWSGDGSDQTSFEGADLRGANLDGVSGSASFAKADCRRATFRGSALGSSGKVSFAEAELQWANFEGANVNRLNFEGANLNDADFQGVTGSANFDKASCLRTNFQGAVIGSSEDGERKQSSFVKTNLREARMNDGDFRCCRFTGADLGAASFRNANLGGALFRNVNAILADLRGARLVGIGIQDDGFPEAGIGRDSFGVFWRGAKFHGATLGPASPFQFLSLCRYAEGLQVTLTARPWVVRLRPITRFFKGLWRMEFSTRPLEESANGEA